MIWALDTIGEVTRNYKASSREELKNILQTLQDNLKSGRIGDKDLLEAHLRTFIYLGHHLQYQAVGFLANWAPKCTLEVETLDLVANFVGTRAYSFASDMIKISADKRHFFAKNNRGRGGLSYRSRGKFRGKRKNK